MAKKVLLLLLIALLSACGSSTLDGKYSSGGPADLSFIFKPDGTAQMAVGGSIFPGEYPYEVSGNEIKLNGQEGDILITIADNGDLLAKGMRFKKEGAK